MQACIDAAQGNKDFADSVSSFYGIIAIGNDGEDTWGGQPGVSFGSQVIGSVSNPATVSISNTGGMELTVNSVTTSEFKLALAPGTTGLRSGQLVITSKSNNVPGTQTSFALTGTGVEPHLDVAPNPISFAAPGRQVITLTGNGSMSVRVFSWTLTGIDATSFALDVPTCSTGGQLQPGAFLEQGTVCSLSLGFKPRRTGLNTATLEIQDSTGLHSVPISGVGP